MVDASAQDMNAGLDANLLKRFESGFEIRIDSLQTGREANVTVLFGPSGTGKTTVLRCLAGLERPEEGRISFNGRMWFDTTANLFLPACKRRIGFVSQQYALFPHLSIEQNIAYGLKALPPKQKSSRVREMLKWLGLHGLEKRLPNELSGGQQQRVALGRAVAPRPELLLLDEPLGALDSPTRQRLRSELRMLLKETDTPALLVTHDRTDALALGDDLVVMNSGRIAQHGRVIDVFTRPANLAVAEIVAMETVQPGRVLERGELVTVAIAKQVIRALDKGLGAGVSEVFVCIRAEDVIVIKGDPVRGSARNCLAGVVGIIAQEGQMIGVQLDCGFPLRAFLTRQACEELTLRTGDHVQALIKAPHVHLIPRTAA
jgi:molybdate transport system ATP-binding protein